MSLGFKRLMCRGPTHKMQRNTVHVSTVVFCAVVWLFPNSWKELTALIFMCPVDEAELSATNFMFMWPCIVTFMWTCIIINYLLIKPTTYTDFPNLLWHETLHVMGSSSAHHQEFIHSTLGNSICHTGLKTAFKQFRPGPAWKLSSNLYDIYQCRVYSE